MKMICTGLKVDEKAATVQRISSSFFFLTCVLHSESRENYSTNRLVSFYFLLFVSWGLKVGLMKFHMVSFSMNLVLKSI